MHYFTKRNKNRLKNKRFSWHKVNNFNVMQVKYRFIKNRLMIFKNSIRNLWRSLQKSNNEGNNQKKKLQS